MVVVRRVLAVDVEQARPLRDEEEARVRAVMSDGTRAVMSDEWVMSGLRDEEEARVRAVMSDGTRAVMSDEWVMSGR